MAAFQQLLHLLRIIWSFFCRLLAKADSKYQLPTSSPATRDESLTYMQSVKTFPSLTHNLQGPDAWETSKKRFLSNPSLMRASVSRNLKTDSTSHSEDHRQTRGAKGLGFSDLASPIPDIFVQDWSTTDSRVLDIRSPSMSCASSTSEVLPSFFLEDLKEVISPDPIPKIVDVPLDGGHDGFPNRALQEADINHSNIHGIKLALPFNTRYSSHPFSAVTKGLWDAPSSVVLLAIAIPVIPNDSRIKLDIQSVTVPYPDVFDLSIYDRRASEGNSQVQPLFPSFSPPPDTMGYQSLTTIGRATLSPGAFTSKPEVSRRAAYDRLTGESRQSERRFSGDSCLLGPQFAAGSLSSAESGGTPPLRIVKNSIRATGLGHGSSRLPLGFVLGGTITNRAVCPSNGFKTLVKNACEGIPDCDWTEEEFLEVFGRHIPI